MKLVKGNGTKESINTRRFSSKIRLIIIITLAMAILVLFDFTPFGGNIHFYSTWIGCGHKPVRIVSAPGAGMAWYETPPSVELVRFGQDKYYCTPAEATAAGYASSQYGY